MKPHARLVCGATFLALIGCGDPQVRTGGNGSPTPGGSGATGGSSGGSSSGGGGFTLPDPPAGGGMTPPTGPTMPSGDMNCGVKRHNLEKKPAELLLVLDRSGSMLEPVTDPATGMGVEKWTATVGALDAVLQATQAQVSWGLKIYPSGAECDVADPPEVPVAGANHAAVMASINGMPAMRGGGSTPTQAAVRKATTIFQNTPSPNNRFLLVATDGEPNCGQGGFGGGGRRSDRAGAVAAVADALKAGIPSFIVGIATTGSDAHETLNMMADAGGRPRTDATKYYPVASRMELITALELITGQIASCTFPLDPPPPVPENVAVEVDGVRITKDANQVTGWSYGPGNRSIVLHGEVCDRLKAGTAKDVQILYGCPGAIIP